MQGMYKHLLLHAIDYLKYIRQPGRLPPTEKDVLHNPREALVVRIGMGRKASFGSQ